MKRLLPRKYSLFFKFTSITFIFLLIVFIIGGILLMNTVRKQSFSALKSHAQSVTRMIADYAAFHIDKFSYFAVEEQTRQLQNTRPEDGEIEILSILVYDPFGKKINASGIEHNQISLSEENWLVLENPCIFYQPNTEPRVVGKVIAVFSLSQYYEKNRQLRLLFVFIGIFILLLLDTALAVLVMVFITTPLEKLARSTREMAKGNFDVQLDYQAKDEIGELSRDFNIMAEQLNLYVSEIQDLNKNLEQKVDLRTQELAEERNKLKIRNTQMEQDLCMARKIQEQLIPSQLPLKGMASFYKPMEQVGGDFYDFISFQENGAVGIFLSDVSGHGIPAAFITTMIKSFIQRAGQLLQNPALTLAYLNQALLNQTAGNFVTAFYGIYHPETLTLTYASAGHNDPYLIRDTEIVKLHPEHKGFPLAVFGQQELLSTGIDYQNYTQQMTRGERLLLYTDGMMEATPLEENNLFFEENGLMTTLEDLKKLPPQMFIQELYLRLKAFRGCDSFEDDLCMVCLDC